MNSKSEAIRTLLRDRPGINPAEAKRLLAERSITISSTLFRLARLRWSKKLDEERRADVVFRQLGDEEWLKDWSWTRNIHLEEFKRRAWRRFLRRWWRMSDADREAEARKAVEVERSRREWAEHQERLQEEQEQRRRELDQEKKRVLAAMLRPVSSSAPSRAPGVSEDCATGQYRADTCMANAPTTNRTETPDSAWLVPVQPTSLKDYLERRRDKMHGGGTEDC